MIFYFKKIIYIIYKIYLHKSILLTFFHFTLDDLFDVTVEEFVLDG